jgi:trehalose 6-phosphate phosphatase
VSGPGPRHPGPADPRAVLEALRRDPGRSGIFLDFDGTLSEIVARPELARPHPDVPAVLARLARTYALVAVVTGRPGAVAAGLLGVSGVRVFGLYGLEGEPRPRPLPSGVRREAEEAAGGLEGVWVEDKEASLAVHFRGSPDPASAGRRLAAALDPVARRHGLRVLPGKMVLELAPPETPGKGAVVLREVRAGRLSACLYAGDDRVDLEAFAALDVLRDEGVEALKVAVRSAGTPGELMGAADLVVEGPGGLVELLDGL